MYFTVCINNWLRLRELGCSRAGLLKREQIEKIVHAHVTWFTPGKAEVMLNPSLLHSRRTKALIN